MADKVKHWPSWANWYARDESGSMYFYGKEPAIDDGYFACHISNKLEKISEDLELIEIDPDTPWQDSKQRRPE